MSLVAYDASDDSDDETETPESVPEAIPLVENSVSSQKTSTESGRLSGLFKSLPPPKRSAAMDAKGPTANKVTKKEPVQIVIPSLKEFEDDEDDIQKTKRKPSMVGSGLIGMLPEPQNVALKASAQKLIPYALSKKPTVTSKKPTPKKAPPHPPASDAASDVASDVSQMQDNSDDENITDFFSLSESSATAEVTTSDIEVKVASSTEPVANSNPVNPAVSWNQNQSDENSSNGLVDYSGYASVDYNSFSNVSANYEGNTSAVYDTANTSTNYGEQSNYAYDYNASGQVDWSYQPTTNTGSDNQSDTLQNDAILRLAGKKQSSRENIQFVDVKGDDLVAGREEWLLKNLSEESGYQSAPRKSDQPSAAHRRKHQITYLAFQAKAREQELKNQWAMNRMTKKQTQSKYGF